MRWYRIADEGLGPYVVAEMTESQELEAFARDWEVLRADVAAARYPEAVLAWQRADDRVARASRVVAEAESTAHEAWTALRETG
ncbi:MAG TPA: hypothetical protein VFT27_13120 [Actinomycetota bacterium]|nr:hypothetical protein [Actinomycetota bacterium]